MIIRPEQPKDYNVVFELITNAFLDQENSDHKEQFLVERLRKSNAFIPELSLVAEINGKIVGYILLTRIKIVSNKTCVDSLALAPLAVLPSYQRKGIGGEMILTAHQKAKELGFCSVILIGHEKYYPRFGYEQAKTYGIFLPFDVPDEYCMLIELSKNALRDVKGMVQYPKEFYE